MIRTLPSVPPSPVVRRLGLGFLYWLAFVLILEPDNVLRAMRAGMALSWPHEALRLTAAGLLGALATPPILAFVRRFPIERPVVASRVLLQAGGAVAAAVALIAVSVVLARAGFGADGRSFAQALVEELMGNGPVLLAAVAVLMSIANASRRPAPAPGTHPYLTRIAVRARGGSRMVDLDQVDWIETQGNYLALHVGGAEHLVRESLGRLEPRLDPRRFVRIHRRVLVAVDRVERIASLGAGDAEVRLKDGTELRLSRTYRENLTALAAAAAAGPYPG